MAGADYRSCDVCGGKTFYDAGLGYEFPHRKECLTVLPGVGDWAVICKTCALTHECKVVPRKVPLVEVPCPENVKWCPAFHAEPTQSPKEKP